MRKIIANYIESNILTDNLPVDLVRPLWFFINKWEREKYKLLTTQTIEGGYTLKSFIENKCIFVHIPKAAGISIAESMFGNRAAGLTTLRRYELLLGSKNFHDFYKFTFTRNPATRLVSAYRFLKRGGMTEQDAEWGTNNLSKYNNFNDFVEDWINEDSIRSWVHFKPQNYFLKNRRGKIEMDFIGKVESIEDDFIHVCKKLRLPAGLKHTNRSSEIKQIKLSDYYNDSTLAKIKCIYAEDFETFSYTADLD